ncbi:hypothetical protein J1C73_33130 [Streptomyces laculatispora]|nr:hypothetical protein [Streptomyces laculatispora]
MDVEVGGDFLVELGEELLELRGAVAAVERADDLASSGVQRREQGGDAAAQKEARASSTPLAHDTPIG